jgi:hypothetical protein
MLLESMRQGLVVVLAALGALAGAAAAQAQPYNNDKWSPAYAARWANEAFSPVDRLVVWRSDVKVTVLSTPDLSSMGDYAKDQLQSLIGAIDFRHQAGPAATPGAANYVICVGPVYSTTNNACDAAYLAGFRTDWYAKGLISGVPDPVAQSQNEDAPLLNRCSYFTDKSGSIAAAFVSISSLDSRETIRNCLTQGLGLSFWKIEAFFKADYSTDENAHGIKNHELSLLKAGYWVDRLGCAGTADKVACFQKYIEQAERDIR